MLYLSELIGKPIVDHKRNTVARIRDFVAELVAPDPQGQQIAATDDDGEPIELDLPTIKGIVARTSRRRQPFFLPIAQIESLDKEGARILSLKVDLQPFERREGEMLLTRDLWDKQIIDLKKRRVVRVNDIVISSALAPASETSSTSASPNTSRWWVRGVDVSIGGLLRRLRIAKLIGAIAPKAVQPDIVRWQHLDVFGSNVQGGVPLRHDKLANFHPVEIARLTDAVSYHQGAEIIASLDDTLAADTLEEITPVRQTDIMEQIPEARAADILEEMGPDEASDLLAEMPYDMVGSLLEEMDQEDAQEVRHLMRYRDKTAGGAMTTDFVRVTRDMTVAQVIETNKPIFLTADLIYYIYVVASEETSELVGVITVRDLLVHDRDKPVSEFMLTEFLSATPNEHERDVARKMAEYNLLALPVVDSKNTLLGVVTVDDTLESLLPEGWRKRIPRIFS